MNKKEKDKLEKVLNAYLKEIHKTYAKRNFREESFYSSLKGLFENCSGFFPVEEGAGVLVSPKRTEVGIPDILIRTDSEEIGNIEAKTPDSNLQEVEKSEQIQRYRNAIPNLILTNFLDFKLYRDGKLRYSVEICKLSALQGLKLPVAEKMDLFFELLSEFYSFSVREIKTPSELAILLADKTKLSRKILMEVLEKETEPDYIPIISFYEAFRKVLIEGLTKERFVDLYAQTITYGLFAAKMIAGEEEIKRGNAWEFVPGNVPLLRTIFHIFSGPDAPEAMSWIINDIVNVLNKTRIKVIFQDTGAMYDRDPIIHFYDTFLGEYNPEEKKKLGVYYTPPEVVAYIVASVHKLLKEKFGKHQGLAEYGVKLLDPAAGTLIFVIRAIGRALAELKDHRLDGLIPSNIKEHILSDFFAFEILIVPYVVGHLRVAMYLEDKWGYKLKDHERMKFYLTNSLELKEPEQALLLPELTEEGKKASEVKEKVPIQVVIGNPPYSVSSENKSDFIEMLMEDYKKEVRREKNIQPLSDDYIKFIRFAHWKINQTGKGIVGFISNNSYLSGVIHRGMRRKLLETFDEIYILNLHGSSRIGEKTPEGGKDENVFDIQQGVAIAIYVKLEKPLKEKKVYYADVWGSKKEKLDILSRNDVKTTEWEWKFEPKEPYYFFEPKHFALQEEYDKFREVTDIFKEWSSGIMTSRDRFVVGFTKEEIVQRLRLFTGSLPDEAIKEKLILKDTRTWKLSEVRQKLKGEEIEDKIYPYAYRPFDTRRICYESILMDRDRLPFMKNLLNDNFSIVLKRSRYIKTTKFHHIYVVATIGDMNFMGDRSFFFPLYLYPDKTKGTLLDAKASKPESIPNFTDEFLQALKDALGTEPIPEEIFYYIYSVLYSPTYRKRYEELLMIDFPKVPLPKDYEKFKKLSELGKELVELHLLKHSALQEIDREIGFPRSGSNKAENVRYDEENRRVYFNKGQYFDGISKEVWESQIGAYQVMAKYLKDRKGRELSLEEIEHYMKVGKTIEKTIEAQEKVDEVFGKVKEAMG